MKQSVSINIEQSNIRILVSRGRKIERWLTEPLEPGLVVDGVISDCNRMASIITQIFKRNNLPRKNIMVSVAGMRTITRILSLPEISPGILQEALYREARREMPVSAEQLYLFWSPSGTHSSGKRYFIAGADRESVDKIRLAFKMAGFKNITLGFKPLALARASGLKKAIIVDLEKEQSLISVISKGFPWTVRTLAAIKEGPDVKESIRYLADEISRTIQYYNSTNPEDSLEADSPLILSGEMVSDEEMSTQLGSSIKHPVTVIRPPMDYRENIPIPRYATNAGMALSPQNLRGFLGRTKISPSITPDLFPLKYPPVIAPSGTSWLIMSLLFLMASIALLLLRENKDWQIIRIAAESTVADTRLETARKLNIQINAASTRLKNIENERINILQGQRHYISYFTFVMDSQVSGLKVQVYNQSFDRIQIEGESVDYDTVVRYVRLLESFPSFTNVYLTSMTRERMGGTAFVSFGIEILLKDQP